MKTISLKKERTILSESFWGRLKPRPFLRAHVPFRAESSVAEPRSPEAGGKVLLIDDDPVIQKTTSAKLSRAGYEVIAAADCSEAIAALGNTRPAVILLDLNFPPDVASGGGVSWDGFRLMYWLRGLQNSRGARFIIITSCDSAECEKRALASGAAAFFPKPIDHDRLLRVIADEIRNVHAPKVEAVRSFDI